MFYKYRIPVIQDSKSDDRIAHILQAVLLISITVLAIFVQVMIAIHINHSVIIFVYKIGACATFPN